MIPVLDDDRAFVLQAQTNCIQSLWRSDLVRHPSNHRLRYESESSFPSAP